VAQTGAHEQMEPAAHSSFAPFELTKEDLHHGLVSLNLLGAWNDWIRRRVESIEFVSDVTVRRRVSVDFTLRAWMPEPILDWDESKVHYIPIALLNKEPLLGFDLRDEAGSAVPLLTRRRDSAIAAATLVAMAQLSIWVRLAGAVGTHQIEQDPDLPDNPLRIRLPEIIEAQLLKIAYRPYHGPENAREVLDEFLAEELDSNTPALADWKWRRIDPRQEARGVSLAGNGADHATWTFDDHRVWRYELARDPKMTGLLEDLARLWMVCVPVMHEPGKRRIIKFCYYEHRMEPQLRLIAAVKQRTSKAGGWLGTAEDRLEGLPCGPAGQQEWHEPTRSSKRIGFWMKFSQALTWRGHVVNFTVPAVGKGGSYHLDLTAPEGTQIRRATLAAGNGRTAIPPKAVRGARGMQHTHLYVENLPSGMQGRATITLKPRASTIVRSLALMAIGAFVMLAAARWKLTALTDRKHGTSGTLAPVFLLFPGVGAALIARSTEHSMTTSMLFGLRLLALSVAAMPLIGASLLAVARRWPHLGLVWWILVIASFLLAALLLVSWRLASRRRPDGSSP
jgi:hypothetical protein